jgi:ribonuclease HI
MKTGAGAGLLFVSPLGEHMRYAVRLHFPASNNMAEYEALLCGLKIAIELGVKRLDVRGDSQLVIDQVMKNASCHDDKMEAYCKAVRALEDKLYGIELNHVPRRYNEEADELAKIASGRITVPPNVFARDIAQPSVVFEPHPLLGGLEIEPSHILKIKSGYAKDAGSKTSRSSKSYFVFSGHCIFIRHPSLLRKLSVRNPQNDSMTKPQGRMLFTRQVSAWDSNKGFRSF